MTAYYNEIHAPAAQTLRNLIAAGHIAPGDVDERSIEDVRPDDLKQYTQCHFFAGIGGWPLALRLAGWSDDEPVWTMSCPCQPFSAAGKGAGFDDERHLWPSAQWLVAERRPAVVFGEQVASKDAESWLDLVSLDLEGLGYAFGATAFPSAGVGAPHIRDRTYFVAHANDARSQGWKRVRERAAERIAGSSGVAGGLGHTDGNHARRHSGNVIGAQAQVYCGGALDGVVCDGSDMASGTGELADAGRERRNGRQGIQVGCLDDGPYAGRLEGHDGSLGVDEARISRIEPAGPTNGFWRAADWLLCRDEKWRPVEPGTFPLVDGLPRSMGKLNTGARRLAEVAGLDAASLARAKSYRVESLRGYGNAINIEAACAFIEAASEALDDYDLI